LRFQIEPQREGFLSSFDLWAIANAVRQRAQSLLLKGLKPARSEALFFSRSVIHSALEPSSSCPVYYGGNAVGLAAKKVIHDKVPHRA
jgi:hypothetical protein